MKKQKEILSKQKSNGALGDVSGQLPPLIDKLIGEHNIRMNLGFKQAALHEWVVKTIKQYYPETEDRFAE